MVGQPETRTMLIVGSGAQITVASGQAVPSSRHEAVIAADSAKKNGASGRALKSPGRPAFHWELTSRSG